MEPVISPVIRRSDDHGRSTIVWGDRDDFIRRDPDTGDGERHRYECSWRGIAPESSRRKWRAVHGETAADLQMALVGERPVRKCLERLIWLRHSACDEPVSRDRVAGSSVLAGECLHHPRQVGVWLPVRLRDQRGAGHESASVHSGQSLHPVIKRDGRGRTGALGGDQVVRSVRDRQILRVGGLGPTGSGPAAEDDGSRQTDEEGEPKGPSPVSTQFCTGSQPRTRHLPGLSLFRVGSALCHRGHGAIDPQRVRSGQGC